jgi:hypothetical protein
MAYLAGTCTPEHEGAARGTDSFAKQSNPVEKSGSVLASQPGQGESGGAPGKPVAPGTGGMVGAGVGAPFAKA